MGTIAEAKAIKPQTANSAFYTRIREILESARAGVARTVNTTQVVSNWLIGQEIVEEEQKGGTRAEYGKRLVEELSKRLLADYGSGYSVQNLWFVRQFYLNYPQLLPQTDITTQKILYAPRRESWKPGTLHPNLSWTHYRTLLRVDKPEARAFYEIEATKNNWSARELERLGAAAGRQAHHVEGCSRQYML